MSNLVAWGTYDADAVTRELQEFDRGKVEFFKPSSGKNVIRILPAPEGKRSPYKVVHQHYVQTPERPNGVGFVCPAFASRAFCPACKLSNELLSTGNQADRQRAYQLKAKARVFVVVIDRAHPERGPQPFAYGKQIKEALEDFRRNLDVDVTHPEQGYDIVLIRDGSGKNDTEYRVHLSKSPSPISTDADELRMWAESMPDLDKYGAVKPLEEIYEALGVQAKNDASLVADVSTQKSRKSIAARASKREPTIDDTEEDDNFNF